MKTPVTQYDIQALIDGELSPEEEKRVKDYIRSNSEARQQYEEICEQTRLLQLWWNNKSRHH